MEQWKYNGICYGLAAVLGVVAYGLTRNWGVLAYAAGAGAAFVGYEFVGPKVAALVAEKTAVP